MRRLAPVVAAAVVGVAGVAAAALTTIDAPATVATPAVRGDVATTGPVLAGCAVYPPDNAWNTDVSAASLHPDSAAIVAKIQSVGGDFLHPDFGENPDYGIPYVVVPADQALAPVEFTAYGDESDPGPYPVPPGAPIEGGPSARETGTCSFCGRAPVTCSSSVGRSRMVRGGGQPVGARFDLTSNALRPLGWTSADAAGLAILPGLVRYDEVAAGEIRHTIRITFDQTRRGYVLPATHFASTRTDPTLPPMGLRLRLRAGYDTSHLTGQALVIAVAMQRYGVMVADNGSNWFFLGAPSTGWDDDDLNQLKRISGSEFEVVDTGPVRT